MSIEKNLVIAVLLLIPAMVVGQATYDTGAYIGGAIGSSEFEDDGAYDSFASAGITTDLKDTALRFYGGYKIAKHIAIEGRYMDYGEFTFTDFGSSLSLEAESVSIHGIGILPVGNGKWELFAQLGIGTIRFKSTELEFTHDETAASAGLGVRYSPGAPITVGLNIDAIAWESDLPDNDPSISTVQISFQYNFCAAARCK